MDKLTETLREDAANIDVAVSPELDERIRASLEAVEPQRARPSSPAVPRWWLSSLVGAAAALGIIAFVNLDPDPGVPESTAGLIEAEQAARELFMPPAMNFEAAVFTAPLEQELDNLESDLRKAEQAVRAEFGLDP